MEVEIREFELADEAAVIALWERCGLLRPWNDPRRDIQRKLLHQPELFLVAEESGEVVGSAMAGYDGHRGAVYYLAVSPDRQATGLGRSLMSSVEARLLALGCPKLNILVRSSNTRVLGFYERLGYERNEVESLGKRLIPDA